MVSNSGIYDPAYDPSSGRWQMFVQSELVDDVDGNSLRTAHGIVTMVSPEGEIHTFDMDSGGTITRVSPGTGQPLPGLEGDHMAAVDGVQGKYIISMDNSPGNLTGGERINMIPVDGMEMNGRNAMQLHRLNGVTAGCIGITKDEMGRFDALIDSIPAEQRPRHITVIGGEDSADPSALAETFASAHESGQKNGETSIVEPRPGGDAPVIVLDLGGSSPDAAIDEAGQAFIDDATAKGFHVVTTRAPGQTITSDSDIGRISRVQSVMRQEGLTGPVVGVVSLRDDENPEFTLEDLPEADQSSEVAPDLIAEGKPSSVFVKDRDENNPNKLAETLNGDGEIVGEGLESSEFLRVAEGAWPDVDAVAIDIDPENDPKKRGEELANDVIEMALEDEKIANAIPEEEVVEEMVADAKKRAENEPDVIDLAYFTESGFKSTSDLSTVEYYAGLHAAGVADGYSLRGTSYWGSHNSQNREFQTSETLSDGSEGGYWFYPQSSTEGLSGRAAEIAGDGRLGAVTENAMFLAKDTDGTYANMEMERLMKMDSWGDNEMLRLDATLNHAHLAGNNGPREGSEVVADNALAVDGRITPGVEPEVEGDPRIEGDLDRITNHITAWREANDGAVYDLGNAAVRAYTQNGYDATKLAEISGMDETAIVEAGKRIEGSAAISMEDPALGRVLDVIAEAEGTSGSNGYNGYFGHGNGDGVTDITSMTLRELRDFQDNIPGSSAATRYQIMYDTLPGIVEEMGLDWDQQVTPELQDAMAVHLMERRGLSDYLNGEITTDKFMSNLSKEWAGLPGPDGNGYYEGYGLNGNVTYSTSTVRDALEAMRESYQNPPAPEPDLVAEIDPSNINRIVTLGDSITNGTGAALASKTGIPVLNLGVDSAPYSTAEGNIPKIQNGDVVVISEGTNWIGANADATALEDYRTKMQDRIDAVVNEGGTPVLLGLKVGADFGRAQGWGDFVNTDANNVLKELAEKNNLVYVDRMDIGLAGDKMHPNSYSAVADKVLSAIDEAARNHKPAADPDLVSEADTPDADVDVASAEVTPAKLSVPFNEQAAELMANAIAYAENTALRAAFIEADKNRNPDNTGKDDEPEAVAEAETDVSKPFESAAADTPTPEADVPAPEGETPPDPLKKPEAAPSVVV